MLLDRWRWLEESGQWLENVNRTLLVLASGKVATSQYYKKCTCCHREAQEIHRSAQFILEIDEEEGLDEAEHVAEDEADEQEDAGVQLGEDLLDALPASRLKKDLMAP